MALLQAGVMWAGEKQPVPAVKISLESLGYPGASQSFLDAGASMLTVNFLDDKHLLVTYSERNLVPRLVGDPEEHDDRLVAGEVVELPTGKVLAKTEWHMHDHARYLWPLGRGRFLLRIEGTLYTMAPLARMSGGEGAVNPFERAVLPGRQAKPTLVYTSEDGGMLTVESQVGVAQKAIEVSNTTVVPQTVTIIDFYRLEGDGSAESALVVTPVGEVRSPEPFYLPITADGYMWPQPSGNGKWALTFDDFTGKTHPVATLDSSCSPRVEMVSPSEFVAMTCRGAAERIRMGSYGMDGTETWQEDVGDYGQPTFAYAPAAGRFAVSHRTERPTPPGGVAGLLTGKGMGPSVPPGAVDQPVSEGQEVRVYQNASGDLLLKLQVSPALKTAENFDLSADGTEAVVTKDGFVAVYKLPALGKRDKEDIAEVAKFAPAATTGAVRLTLLVGPAANPARRKLPMTEGPGGQETSGSVAVVPAVDVPTQTAGDAPANAGPGRKPPTLLKPGEKPEFGKSNAEDGAGAPPPQ
jgi:hypothetical protein